MASALDADTALTAVRASRSDMAVHAVHLAGWQPQPELHGVENPGAPPALGQHLPTQERVLLEIARHAVELREFHAESLSVVLRPDADTEIVLHLTQQANVVEVTARFERGDLEQLKANWGQLQQALSHQGIRVNALEEPLASKQGNPVDPGQSQSSQLGERDASHPHRERSAEPDDLGFVGASTETPRRRLSRGAGQRPQLWETWA